MISLPTDPVLTCEQSLDFEQEFFESDLEQEWQMMTRAGEGIGDALLRDVRELRTIPHRPRLLALVGKGHNGGDALIATKRFLRTIPTARAVLLPLEPWQDCRPLTQRAWEELNELADERLQVIDPSPDSLAELEKITEDGFFHAMVDGWLGIQAKLPLRDPMPGLIRWINQSDKVAVRASVDLPTGVTGHGTENPLRVDFTYCTGIVKEPVLDPVNAEFVGRIRYLDLGFFQAMKMPEINQRVLRPSALQTLRRLRFVQGDKRSHGHLFLLAGSRELGGAALMAAEASLKAGVGLLTVGIPESLHASFVAQLPEAMWVPLPETPNGCIALEGLGKIRQITNRASAFAAGPGLGVEKETFSLVRELCNFFKGPILLDADAIQAEILEKIIDLKRVVITPHAGELKRLVGKVYQEDWISQQDCTLVLKGSHTQIWSSQNCIFSLGGSSALARGGSGDILTGILGALLAKNSHSIPDSCCLGVQWHGRAAEVLARQHGQESIRTTEILSYLSFALRNDF